MKNYISKYKFLGRVGLVALLSLTHSQALSISGTALINFSGSIALREERHISNFFDKNNTTSWTDFVALFKNEIKQLDQKLNELTRSPGDALLTDAVAFADYIIQQFNAIIYVFEKHNGKNNITAFQNDIDALNFEKTFVVCKEKLEAIRVKAIAANDVAAMEAIDKLIKALEIKRKEWSTKLTKKLTLLAAVTKRMAI